MSKTQHQKRNKAGVEHLRPPTQHVTLSSDKPLPEPMLTCCQLAPQEHISIEFCCKFWYFHKTKLFWNVVCELAKCLDLNVLTICSRVSLWPYTIQRLVRRHVSPANNAGPGLWVHGDRVWSVSGVHQFAHRHVYIMSGALRNDAEFILGNMTIYLHMIPLWHGNAFRIIGTLWKVFTGHRWISLKKGQ